MSNKKVFIKKFFFRLILLAPCTILLIFLILFIHDIYKINKINHKDIHYEVNNYLQGKQGYSFPVLITRKRVDENRGIPNSDINIFVFGGSSIIRGNGDIFSNILEEKLSKNNPHIQVINFGINGIDSFSVKQRVVHSLEATRINPELMIFYMGHNDYTNAYHKVITRFYDSFDFFLKISYFFSNKEYDYYWFSWLKRPIILKFLQQTKLINIWGENYGSYNKLILDYFIKNMNSIINTTSSQKIPIIIITPIGNLHVEPYGDISKVTYFYQQGLDSDDYNESIYYLKKAREAEILTADVRVKQELNDYLRNINHSDVYIYDLEAQLINNKFEFGNLDFMDYFHFNEDSHELIANYLYKFILKNDKLINSLELNSIN